MNKLLYLTDDDFQSQQAAKCDLLIHIGLETFKYAVIDNGREQLKALVVLELPDVNSQSGLMSAIENLPESAKQFKFSYNKIKIAFDTFHFTFIPQELYNESEKSGYAKFIQPVLASAPLVNDIKSVNIKNVSAIDSKLHETLNKLFNKPRIFNQASSFVEGIQKINSDRKASSLFIDIHTKHIQIAWINSSKLMFYNIFECVNLDEFNFYLLSLIDQLNIDTGQTRVILSGKTTPDDDYYQRIQKYFSEISLANTRQLVKYPQKFEKVLSQTYFSLISLNLCE